ncbi:MAG: hypothetical protein IJU55_05180 [Selenomonadaceae bacterium]|nr:hypothetical protein [Selenomonadaceae bacterium]
MNLKKYFAGASAMLIIFTSNPQIFAQGTEVFGEEFDTQNSQPSETPPDEVFTPPAENNSAPPPQPVTENPAPQPVTENPAPQPVAENPAPQPVAENPAPQPVAENPAPQPVAENPAPQPVAENPAPQPVAENPAPQPVAENPAPQPVEEISQPPEEVSAPFEQNESDEDFGDSLNFNNINGQDNPETFSPPQQNETPDGGNITVITPPENNSSRTNNENQIPSAPRNSSQKKLKTLPQRFVQVAVDENYIYYLDKQSVAWKKIPYMNSEYMADVWVRMIEREPDTSGMPEDLAAYVNDTSSDEIALAKAQGYQYMNEDVKVLQNKRYFLERYLLRPSKDQIQFLCELEVVGHPQNTASQRKYDYNNWEELIPGSIESILYYSIIQVIGKGKASERGHMTFIDMVEEYGRISMR